MNRLPTSRPALQRLVTLTLLLPAVLCGPAMAADAGGPSATRPADTAVRDPAEWQAYKDALERYRDRSNELFEEIRAQVDTRDAEQRALVGDSYARLQGDLEREEDGLRQQAIRQIEIFLQKHPTSVDAPDMKFRLADLYFEDSEVTFFIADAEYVRLEEQARKNPSLSIGDPPAKDYSRSIRLYQEIIDQHPTYRNLPDTHYMLGWCYGASNAAQFDPEKARAVNEVTAQRWPNTPFANDANMRLGEYWFDQPGPRNQPTANIPTAIRYYDAVLADGPQGRNYDEAIYKLGWSYYKLNDYDHALQHLVKLLDYSDDQYSRTGRVSSMRPEAVEYLAISYADMGDRMGKRPMDIAKTHLDRVGDRKWQHDVTERLAEILLLQAKYDDAIDVFSFLQDRWPLDPKNPVYQQRIAITYSTMPLPDPAKAGQALARVSEKYSEGTPWYEANRGNPDAIAAARQIIESSLATVAVEYLVKAQETRNPADYARAAKQFDLFLNSFPLASNYDETEWYRALSYFGANQYDEAEAAYAQILKNDQSPYHDGARFQIMKCRELRIVGAYGKIDALPAGAAIESVTPTPKGGTITRYALSPAHAAFIESADDLSSREFSSPDWVKELEADRPALMYLPAQILFVHGRYADARARFTRLIERFPHTDEAVYASSLYVNSYTAEGDLENVRLWTAKFANMDLGANPELRRVKLSEFTDIGEQASFGLALEKIEKNDRAGAAEAFVDFLKAYPNSKFYKEALYNAGNNYAMTGKSADAIRYFESYVAKYPTDERSQFLYRRIAENYSATLELQKSIENYETLVKVFPASPDAPSAAFNAAFLREGLGDHANAARGFERYGTTWPTQPDAEDVTFRAGAEWQQVGDTEALDFYARYLKRYPTQNPSHIIEAWYRTAKLAEKKKDTRRADAAFTQIGLVYTQAGGNVSDRARKYAAEGALDDLMSMFERFKSVKWSTSEQKNVELLTKTKAEERKALEDQSTQLIATYKDYDTAAAALYIQGMSYFAYADMAYNLPPPKGLTPDELDIYHTTVDDKFRLPAEDRGKARLVSALEKARVEKRWSEWNSKALAELHQRYPSEYPSERAESRGSFVSGTMPYAGPLGTMKRSNEGGGQ